MIYIFMSSIISMIFIMVRVRNYESFKERIREYEKSNKRKVMKTRISFSFYLKYLLYLLGVLVLVAFVYMNSYEIGVLGVNLTVSLTVCLISVFVADLFWKGWETQLVYDKEGFFIKQSYFHFNNVKEIIQLDKKNKFEVILHNGKTIKVGHDQARQINLMIKK